MTARTKEEEAQDFDGLSKKDKYAYTQLVLAESNQEFQELDDLEQKIQKRIINSGVLLRKVNEP